jgi:hypothetical protein
MSLIVKRRIKVHINPSMILRLPSTMSSAPIFVSCIFRPFMKSKAILTFSKRWTRSFGLAAYLPNDSCERISRRCIRMVPSERSLTRSEMWTSRTVSLLFNLPTYQYAVTPALRLICAYHLPNVFSWTLIQLCSSSTAILFTRLHQLFRYERCGNG